MKVKQQQVKHWAAYPKLYPHVFKLSELWSRAGMQPFIDTTALRTFRLEMEFSQ